MSKWLKVQGFKLKLNRGDPSLRCCQGDVWLIDRTVERWSAASNTHDGCSKWSNTVAIPSQLGRGVVFSALSCLQDICRLLPPYATSCRENKRSEYTMLNFPDLLSIFPLLGLFMSPVDRWGVCWTVGGCVWVKHPYIKKCICDVFQNPLTWMSTQAPSSVFEEWAVILSPLSD